MIAAIVAAALISQVQADKPEPKPGDSLFCFSLMMKNLAVPATDDLVDYRLMIEVIGKTQESLNVVLPRMEGNHHLHLIEAGTEVEVIEVKEEVLKVRIVDRKHKDKVYMIGKNCLLNEADFIAAVKKEADIRERIDKALKEAQEKRKAILVALGKAEVDANKAADKASRKNRKAVYDRELSRGWDRVAKDFGYGEMTDPKGEMRKFLDQFKPKDED